MNRKVYVANLPPQAREPEIKAPFSKAGNVMSVKIVQNRQTGQPRGIAFVEMSTQWEGRKAVSMEQYFKEKSMLTEQQESILEGVYREKTGLIRNTVFSRLG